MPHLWVPHLAQREVLGNAASYCPDSRLPQRLCRDSSPISLSDLWLPPLLQLLLFLWGWGGSQDWGGHPSCLCLQCSREFPRTVILICSLAPCHKPGVAWFIARAALAINPQSSPALIYWHLLAWVWGVSTKDDGDGSLTQCLELMNTQLASKDQVGSSSL